MQEKILIAKNSSTEFECGPFSPLPYQILCRDIKDINMLSKMVEDIKPHICFVDLNIIKEFNQDIMLLNSNGPNCMFALLGDDLHEDAKIHALLQGMMGFVPVNINPSLMHKIVQSLQSGEPWVDRRLLGKLIDTVKKDQAEINQITKNYASKISCLTPKEVEVARKVALGQQNAQIAQDLKISERTVKAHLSHVFQKLGIQHRVQLALMMQKL